jgi:DNA-directed RNA polymerase II subunit RPB1
MVSDIVLDEMDHVSREIDQIMVILSIYVGRHRTRFSHKHLIKLILSVIIKLLLIYIFIQMPLADSTYGENVGQIKKVSFGILSPTRILEKSVCEIYRPITSYKLNIAGTLLDPRMGPTEPRIECPTCGFTMNNCPGHFGHLVLAKPMIQVKYYTTIIKLLRCFCNRCYSILLDDEMRQVVAGKNQRKRFDFVLKNTKKKMTCHRCSAEQPKYEKSKKDILGINSVYGKDKEGAPFDDKKSQRLNPEIIHMIFKGITDDDARLIGLDPQLSRPEWMIWTIMPIPPPAMRPSVKADSGKTQDDDLTRKLNEIIKYNNQLRGKMTESTPSQLEKIWQLVQYHVATYIDNEATGIAKSLERSGRPLKTLLQRIKAKEGRVRWNLMGKRVNESARSVITADPAISMDQVGVPQRVATNLTYPELVTIYNLEQMTELVHRGPKEYPGAKSYKRRNKENRDNLKNMPDELRLKIVLKPGDVVYRHLMDNDWVLFNRQPSLHKMSMMAHRVKVLDGLTFRLNVNVCAPYGADFDGDEMNIHVPQSLEAVIELRMLVSVPTQIVSPQAGNPVMGMVQDSVLGNYLMSQQKDKLLSHEDVLRLVCNTSTYTRPLPPPEKMVDGRPYWSPKQIQSMMLPEICYQNGALNLDIKGGQIMKDGILSKDAINKKGGSIFHITWNDYGPQVTRDLFDSVSTMAHTWLQIEGFTCGMSDCIVPDDCLRQIRERVQKARIDAEKLVEEAKLGNLPKGEEPINYKKEYPRRVTNVMQKCRDQVETMTEESLKKLEHHNNIDTMIRSASKGSKINLSQITSMLGQQEIDGSWLENQLYRRTLPHFHKDDISPDAHGFAESSFLRGLGPAEYWFHAQEGRIGTITRAIKTAETGYFQRRLIKNMEDLRICYDGTVRNANHLIIQTVYGRDGFDACYTEYQTLPFLCQTVEQLTVKYKHLENEKTRLETCLSRRAYSDFMRHDNPYKILDEEFDKMLDYYYYAKQEIAPSVFTTSGSDLGVRSPIHFGRQIQNIIAKFGLQNAVVADIDPIYIVDKIKQLRSRLVLDPNPRINYVSTIIINLLMAFNLSSKVLIYDYKFTQEAFDYLIETIYSIFLKALINPGENVGIIAAQSIGEPVTQMALSTVHTTGQGSKANISRGTPRLVEIVGLTQNPKVPSLTIYFRDEYFDQKAVPEEETTIPSESKQINDDRLDYMISEIEYTTLRKLLLKTEIVYDPSDQSTCIPEDQEFIDSYYDLLTESEQATKVHYQWLLRMEFNREAVMMKHIPMYLIEMVVKSFIDTQLKDNHSIIFSDENAHKLICRIKLGQMAYDDPTTSNRGDPINFMHDLEAHLLDLRIKGIDGINRCFKNSEKKDIILPDGRTISRYSLDYNEYKKQYNHLRYHIDTEGSNMLDVLCLPNVDTYRTISNNVWEIYEIYGIEAARKCIVSEIESLIRDNSTYIQERHLNLLVDLMTNQGILISADRHGIVKMGCGPLHRASFEETVPQFINASITNEVDYMTGVSSNVMFGQFIPTGTNAFRLALDIDKILTLDPPKQKIRVMKKKLDAPKKYIEPTKADQYCSDEHFEFRFKLKPMVM